MKKYIPVTKEEREKLAKIFKCSERMVYFALTYDPKRGKTNLARKIRHTAKKSGFCVYVVVKEMECMFLHDGMMVQMFPNGAQIEFSTKTGIGTVIYDGKLVAEYRGVKLSEIPSIQERAMAI